MTHRYTLQQRTLATLVVLATLAARPGQLLGDRLADDRGEGVISTAIAVLIVAFIGAAAFVAFQGIFDGAATKTSGVIDGIGS